ncbi:DUF4112 domain-containing protein [Endobacter medicaginis]|uniref:DUF4112 domain-containing protein n=1 Tax=Endobacter medicaginis TaxID=1181271 RepID=A0A850NVC5_9PROT|nr:DUF4112 domain-containing protein [Endobacter medicaginis]
MCAGWHREGGLSGFAEKFSDILRGAATQTPPSSPAELLRLGKRLKRLRRLAWLLDSAVGIPNTKFRFGLSGLIGLTPVAGDAAISALSLYIVYEGYRIGLPRAVLMRMLANVGIEATVGAVPVIGDVFDVAFKANMRNLSMIEAHLARAGLGHL